MSSGPWPLLLPVRTFFADETVRIGLVSRLARPDTVLTEAQPYAKRPRCPLLSTVDGGDPPPGLGGLDRRLSESMVQTVALTADFVMSDDFLEGIDSFVERRKPSSPPLGADFVLPGDLGY